MPISIFSVLTAIGAISATATLIRLVRFSWLYLRPSSLPRYIQPDSYALVTGGTDGIGKSLVKVLLSKGSNVIIHGRNTEKLKKVQSELQSQFPSCKVLIINATAEDPGTAVPAIEKFIKDNDLCVTMLINNLGGGSIFGVSPYIPFAEQSPTLINRILTVNALFPTQLSRALIPLLGRCATSSKQRPSLILNVGSFTGENGMPIVSAYSAGKALMQNLSRALTLEMQMMKQPIEVIGVISAAVSTPGNPDPVKFGIPSSDDFAASVLERVGCGRRTVYGSFVHALQVSVTESLSENLQSSVLKGVMQGRYDMDRKGN